MGAKNSVTSRNLHILMNEATGECPGLAAKSTNGQVTAALFTSDVNR